MKEQDANSERVAELRQRAEAMAEQNVNQSLDDLDDQTPEETRRMIHELRVYQIELEMQNQELRRADAELETARTRYFDLYDLAPVGYCVLSPEGTILEANLTAANLLGMTRKALLTKPITRFILKEDQDIYHLHRKQFIEAGKPYECELRLVKRDGTSFWGQLVVTAALALAKKAGQGVDDLPVSRVVLTDITERKQAAEEKSRLETQLQQAQKLQTIGILAGGVAHDFNNLLAAIVGNADLGSLAVEPESKVAHYFETIELAAMRAASLTSQMLAYSGQGKYLMTEVNLDIVVKEVTQLLGNSIPSSVTIRYELMDRLPFVKGDPTQIFQILMNLVTNASEAIEDGQEGQIVIRTAAERIEADVIDSSCWALPLPPGHYATLEVTDTGIGMAPEILALAFDPFFSTKFTGRGLGLAAVIGILGSHGGGIRVRSNPGQGSSFKILLPAMRGERSTTPEDSLPTWRGEGRILVVDDEETVRSVARQMAERIGFTVIEAAGGREGVELFRAHHEEITLVLLDLSMPRMGGWEAFKEIRKIDRQVPVILSSGYDVQTKDMRVEGLAGFLKKPYRIAEFQKLLQRSQAQRSSALSREVSASAWLRPTHDN